MESLISVVVPVYCVEEWLEGCIESILRQTYTNIELILVDDGSPDRCGEICDEYARIDKRVKVVHKENGGASSARNTGIDMATGEYLVFVDSDDILTETCIETLYSGIQNNGYQYVAGALSQNKKNKIGERLVIDFDKNPKCLLKYLTNGYGICSYGPYAKMFKLAIIKEKAIRFNTELKCSEDALFIREYMSYCNKILLMPDVVYIYNTNNEGSLSHKGYEDFGLYFVKKLESLEKLVKRLNLLENEKAAFLSQRAIHGIKISAMHYITHFDNDIADALVKRALEKITPYINVERKIGNINLECWWRKHKENIKNNPFKFRYNFERELLTSLKVKRIIKNIIKKR